MKRCVLAVFVATLVVLAGQHCSAEWVAISLDPDDWEMDGYPAGWQDPNIVFEQTSEGHLRATKRNGTGGTSWAISRQSVPSFNFQNATLRLKWLVNPNGNSYSAIYQGITNQYYADPNYPRAGYYSTHHSWLGSEVIPGNTWLYTEITYLQNGAEYTVGSTGYGVGDLLAGTETIYPTTWDLIQDNHVWFRLVDNHSGGAYYELAEASVRLPDAAVPEPGAVILWSLLGLSALGGLRCRKR